MTKMKRFGALVIIASLAMIGCNGGGEPGAEGETSGGVVELRGAGASFPAPLYQRWFSEYSKAHDDVKIEYASVGSGSGVSQFQQKLVDFGASDAAMSDEEMAEVKEGVQLLPMTAGAIVFAYNLSDADGNKVENLKLSRKAYMGIILGTITNWNDPEIAKANPDLKLPDQSISFVYRSDSSGTTYVFTLHLAEISDEWDTVNKTVEWPTGSGAPKNDGIAGAVAQNAGSIGYVEYGYASKNGIPMAILENASGEYVAPTPESAQAALGAIEEVPADFRIWLPDPQGADAYPIVTYTWIMCYKTYEDAAKLEALKACFEYCLTTGQEVAPEMGYIPLPKNVVDKSLEALKSIESK